MLQSIKFQNALKALLLIGLGLFLYSRIANGTLYYYIAQRFASYTLIAIVGLIVVGLSYYSEPKGETHEPHEHDEDEHHQHAHNHEHNHEHNHSHGLTWSGVFLVALPMLLGMAVPPQPLGAAALSNRQVNVTSSGSTMPAAVRAASQKSSIDKNVLDWSQMFKSTPDAANKFAGEPVKVTGFVFRDERFAADQFLVTRFVVSCCVADGNVAGVVVQWQSAVDLPTDQWVEVSGKFAPGALAGETIPVVTAESVTKIPVPNQPYLYP